jgi:hypothetical protein|tara:strand:+ start:87 stop:707 length:621 start_codon:yes stop_codon:yes gene_type:complete
MNHSRRPFDKQQLIFIVDTILSAGLDSVDTTKKYGEYCDGCASTAGMALATLFAQLTGHGMAIYDAIELSGFHECGRAIIKGNHDTRSYAIKFVNDVFESYLQSISAEIDVFNYNADWKWKDGVIPGSRKTKTNGFNCEEVFVKMCKELYNDNQGNDFESWICELADVEEFSIDLAMRVTGGKIEFPVSVGSEENITVEIIHTGNV